jgi:regulator of sigma E protease
MGILSFIYEYIIGFVLLISVLVFIHELGHYLFAKLFKVRVESFSIGFGKELLGWNDKSGTRWKFCLLPFGGYVKMKGELLPTQNEVIEEDSFGAKKLWQKALIVFAGPLFNLIFPIILLIFISFFSGVANVPAKIGTILENSSAYGVLQKNDLVLQANNIKINDFNDLQIFIASNPNKEVAVKVLRENKEVDVKIVISNKIKSGKELGYLGVSAQESSATFIRYSFIDSVIHSLKIYKKVCIAMYEGLITLFSGNASSDDLGGPIKIAQLSGESLKNGLDSWLFFMAMLSLNLAIINLFPIPALDGGHLLLYLVQAIIRRDINPKIQNILMQSGFMLLMALMVFVILKDILSFLNLG